LGPRTGRLWRPGAKLSRKSALNRASAGENRPFPAGCGGFLLHPGLDQRNEVSRIRPGHAEKDAEALQAAEKLVPAEPAELAPDDVRGGALDEVGQRGRLAGLFYSAGSLGAIAGSIAGGAIAQLVGLPSMFRMAVALMLAVALVIGKVMPRLRSVQPELADLSLAAQAAGYEV